MELSDLQIPEAFWWMLVGGGVQGLIWYGAINVKITTLAERLTRIEREREQDRREHNAQFDSLLRTLIDSLRVKTRQ